jgi:protein lifeguard
VYATLGGQLLITGAVCALFLTHRQIPRFLLSDAGTGVMLLSFGVSLVSAILLCNPSLSTNFPWNFLLLGLFTSEKRVEVVARACVPDNPNLAAGESVMLGSFVSLFRVGSVVLAALQTGVVTLGLTMIAFRKDPKVGTRMKNEVLATPYRLISGLALVGAQYDLTPFGSTLFCGLLVLVLSSLLTLFFKVPIPDVIKSAFGALLFSLFIVYDTQRIVGGHTHELQSKDYIRGAIELYLDITRLMIYILRLTGQRQLSDE